MITFKNGHPDEKTDIPDGEYYTIVETAERLDVGESSVRCWISRGQLASIDYYGRKYVPKNAILRTRRSSDIVT